MLVAPLKTFPIWSHLVNVTLPTYQPPCAQDDLYFGMVKTQPFFEADKLLFGGAINNRFRRESMDEVSDHEGAAAIGNVLNYRFIVFCVRVTIWKYWKNIFVCMGGKERQEGMKPSPPILGDRGIAR